MIVVLIVGGLLLLFVLTSLGSYNRFLRQRNLIANSWSNVDTELQRRHDLIPNLVETVKGYAAHERGTLDAVITARTNAVAPAASTAGEDTTARAARENELSGSLGRLLVLSEAYPALKADAHFLDLQRQLVDTEDRIQAARRLFNANVRDYDIRCQSLPSGLLARLFGYRPLPYLEIEPSARVLPAVGETSPG